MFILRKPKTNKVKEFDGTITVRSSGASYYDVIHVKAETKGAVLDKMVESVYFSRLNLLQYMSSLDKDKNGMYPNVRWYVSVKFPSLTEENEYNGGGGIIDSPDDMVMRVVHYRYMEIDNARKRILKCSSKISDTEMNFSASLDEARNEGYFGYDWDNDFSKALTDGRWKSFLKQQKEMRKYYAYKRQVLLRTNQ